MLSLSVSMCAKLSQSTMRKQCLSCTLYNVVHQGLLLCKLTSGHAMFGFDSSVNGHQCLSGPCHWAHQLRRGRHHTGQASSWQEAPAWWCEPWGGSSIFGRCPSRWILPVQQRKIYWRILLSQIQGLFDWLDKCARTIPKPSQNRPRPSWLLAVQQYFFIFSLISCPLHMIFKCIPKRHGKEFIGQTHTRMPRYLSAWSMQPRSVGAPQKGSTESASTPSRGSVFAGVLSKRSLGLDACLSEGFVYV